MSHSQMTQCSQWMHKHVLTHTCCTGGGPGAIILALDSGGTIHLKAIITDDLDGGGEIVSSISGIGLTAGKDLAVGRHIE